ncbi:HAD-like domain-containing protein, partial [Calycina marina]
FPYALSALPETLATQWDAPSFQQYRDAFPAEHRLCPAAFSAHVHDLMAKDLKIPYLKALQGYLWTRGYESGALVCPLFPDVGPKLKEWHSTGKRIMIYSSGSVPAQKLLFRYTNSDPADLRPLISDYFDTVSAGPKTEKRSYETIAKTLPGVHVDRWLFLSDNVKEVVAAKEADMLSYVVVREGNAPLTEMEREGQVLINTFREVDFK